MNLMQRRRTLMAAQGGGGGGGLPAEYQQVEYVTFPAGTERIRPILIAGEFPAKYEVGFYKTAEAQYCSTPYMISRPSTGYCTELLYTKTSLGIQKNQSSEYQIAASVTSKDKYSEATITARSDGFDALVTVDGTDYTANVSMTHGTASGEGIYIPGSKNNSQMRGRIYFFKFTEGGVLKADLIPCYRKSDSVCGMYDLVQRTFFENIGTGTIGKGGDV